MLKDVLYTSFYKFIVLEKDFKVANLYVIVCK